ncbi:MAG TPA: site-specific integrase [Desulfatiglandales bacterium]|nr:site-specific integrase [Desulfatiglandales bacterium]
MATIRKRGNSYQIDYFDPNGKRVRKSFDKKKDAEAELGKRVSLIAEKRYLDVKKDYTTTFKELLDKYKENYKDQLSFHTWKRFCVKRFKDYFGEDTRLDNIRYVDLETYRNYLKQKPNQHGGVRATASVNREMSCLHHVFTKGVEWEMMERNPFDKGKSLLMKENNKRFRYLNESEITTLLDNCIHDYTKDIIVTVLNTGMRRQEVLSLKWVQIKGEFIYLSETKTNESRQIPVNDDLAVLFQSIRQRVQLRSEYVFCDAKGKPFNDIKTSFKASLRRAGIEDFRFHDLRHTFASHFIMRGGSLKELQEILGHKNITMTMRYAHLSQETKKKAVNLLNGLTSNNGASENETCHKHVTFQKQAL